MKNHNNTNNKPSPTLAVIVAIFTILGTVLGVSARFTSKDTFEEHKQHEQDEIAQLRIEMRSGFERMDSHAAKQEEKLERIVVEQRSRR